MVLVSSGFVHGMSPRGGPALGSGGLGGGLGGLGGGLGGGFAGLGGGLGAGLAGLGLLGGLGGGLLYPTQPNPTQPIPTEMRKKLSEINVPGPNRLVTAP